MNTSGEINRTADLIEERGWQRGPAGWGGGSRTLCLEGALLEVQGETFATVNLTRFWASSAYRALMEYLGRDSTVAPPGGAYYTASPAEPLWSWNDDQPNATVVIEALRSCAAIEESREAIVAAAELVDVFVVGGAPRG